MVLVLITRNLMTLQEIFQHSKKSSGVEFFGFERNSSTSTELKTGLRWGRGRTDEQRMEHGLHLCPTYSDKDALSQGSSRKNQDYCTLKLKKNNGKASCKKSIQVSIKGSLSSQKEKVNVYHPFLSISDL